MSVVEIPAVLGLSLDIFGTLFITRSVLARRPSEARQESATVPGHNLALTRSLITQSREAQIGGGALTLGFILQILGRVLADGFSPSMGFVMAAIAGVLTGLWILLSHWVGKAANREVQQLKRTSLLSSIEQHEIKGLVNRALVERWADEVELTIREGESHHDVLTRVKAKLREP